MRRITVKVAAVPLEGVVVLPRGEAHHVRDVLRLGPGAPVAVADGAGRLWEGTVRTVTGGEVTVLLSGRFELPPPPAPVTVAAALIKNGFDEIVRKAVEIGVARIVPLTTARTVMGLVPKPSRWRRIADQAAKQAGRAYSLEIAEAVPLAEYRPSAAAQGLFVADTEGAAPLLEEALSARPPYEVVVGPEGGLTGEEVKGLRAAGFRAVTLGDGTLRSETAAIAAGFLLGEAWRLRGRGEGADQGGGGRPGGP